MSLTLAIGIIVAALAAWMLFRSMGAAAQTVAGGADRPGAGLPSGPVAPTFAGLKRDAPTGQVATYEGGLVISAKSAKNIAELNRQAQAGLVASLASWNPENPGFLVGWVPPVQPLASLSRSSAEPIVRGYVGYYDPNARVKLPGVVDASGRGYVFSRSTLAFDAIDYHRDFVVLIAGADNEFLNEPAVECAVWDRRTRRFRSTLPPFGIRGTVRFPADRSGVIGINPIVGRMDAYLASSVYGYYRGGMLGDFKASEDWASNIETRFRALRVLMLA